jgi:hypothetical protein
MAVAYVAREHGAEVTYLGTIGTCHGDVDQLIRKRPSKAKHLSFVYEAGPCGSWLSRDLTDKGDDGWVVAPSLIPQNLGDRVNTDHRAARRRCPPRPLQGVVGRVDAPHRHPVTKNPKAYQSTFVLPYAGGSCGIGRKQVGPVSSSVWVYRLAFSKWIGYGEVPSPNSTT